MTDREWADHLHGELGMLMYAIELTRLDKTLRESSGLVDHSWSLADRAFRDYKRDVQKLDYETGRPLYALPL